MPKVIPEFRNPSDSFSGVLQVAVVQQVSSVKYW